MWGTKPRQRARPWAEEMAARKQRWGASAGTSALTSALRAEKRFGRGVTPPSLSSRPSTTLASLDDRLEFMGDDVDVFRSAKMRPEYSIKYVGVTRGEMGILSQRHLIPTSKEAEVAPRPQTSAGLASPNVRLDPGRLRRDAAAAGSVRPSTAPGMLPDGAAAAASGTTDHWQRPATPAATAATVAAVGDEQQPEVDVVEDVVDLGLQPRPEIYNEWVETKALPPGRALSAGRAGARGPPTLEPMAGLGRRPATASAAEGNAQPVSEKQRRLEALRPRTSQGALPGGPQHRRVPPPRSASRRALGREDEGDEDDDDDDDEREEIPYVVHSSVLGWKLTSPRRKMLLHQERKRLQREMELGGIDEGRSLFNGSAYLSVPGGSAYLPPASGLGSNGALRGTHEASPGSDSLSLSYGDMRLGRYIGEYDSARERAAAERAQRVRARAATAIAKDVLRRQRAWTAPWLLRDTSLSQAVSLVEESAAQLALPSLSSSSSHGIMPQWSVENSEVFSGMTSTDVNDLLSAVPTQSTPQRRQEGSVTGVMTGGDAQSEPFLVFLRQKRERIAATAAPS